MSPAIPAVPMPVGWSDVWSARRASPDARGQFEEACARYHGALRGFAVSSGRMALCMALRALQSVSPDRERVILPAYTCPTVGRAVQAAGLSGLCVDVSPDDFNIDVGQVAEALDERTLAVIAPYMFGTPCDARRLAHLCNEAGAALIEDLAQACGARWDNQLVGTFGQLAFLSLGRSKNLRAAGGGVLLVNRPELIGPVEEQTRELPDGGSPGARGIGKQLAITILSKPRMWYLAKRLPVLHIGGEDQRFDDSPTRLTLWQANLGLRALARVQKWNAIRAELGRAMEAALRDMPAVHVQRKRERAQSAYVRLATRLDTDAGRRDAITATLQAKGIDARAFYTRPMYAHDWWRRSPDQEQCPQAQRLVETNLILPIYYGMNSTDALRVAEALGACSA